MALQTPTYTTPAGITVEDAYWRWTMLKIDVPGQRLTVTLRAYASLEAFAMGKAPLGERVTVIRADQFAEAIPDAVSVAVSDAIYERAMATDPIFAEAVEVG